MALIAAGRHVVCHARTGVQKEKTVPKRRLRLGPDVHYASSHRHGVPFSASRRRLCTPPPPPPPSLCPVPSPPSCRPAPPLELLMSIGGCDVCGTAAVPSTDSLRAPHRGGVGKPSGSAGCHCLLPPHPPCAMQRGALSVVTSNGGNCRDAQRHRERDTERERHTHTHTHSQLALLWALLSVSLFASLTDGP